MTKDHQESSEIKELMQQKIILKYIIAQFEKNSGLGRAVDKEHLVQRINELEQQKIISSKLTQILSENNTVDEILTVISHEFKTPLVPVKAYVDMLLKENFGVLTENQKSRLRIVQGNITSIENILSDTLDSKKIELGEITMHKIETNLTKLINDTIEKMNDTKKCILFHYPNEDIIIKCDATRISQVLVNLIRNGKEAIIKETGRIIIDLKSRNDESLITVSDNGKGISPEELPKTFSKYHNNDNSKTRDDTGIGLRLYLCRQIVEAHDGKIWIESKVGKGTSVNFTLPLVLSK